MNTEGLSTAFRERIGRLARDSEAATGEKVVFTSAHRTHEQQKDIYRRSGQGRAFMAAKPGYSRHETGDAVDVSSRGKNLAWMRQNANAYGIQTIRKGDDVHFQMPRTQDAMKYGGGYTSPMTTGQRSQTAAEESAVGPTTPPVEPTTPGNIDLGKQKGVTLPKWGNGYSALDQHKH